jgi:hypothetical protein
MRMSRATGISHRKPKTLVLVPTSGTSLFLIHTFFPTEVEEFDSLANQKRGQPGWLLSSTTT